MSTQSGPPERADLNDIVDYLLYLDGLKGITRHTKIVSGDRFENTAEHSWHVALFALLMNGRTDADMGKVVEMLLVHDLAEIHVNELGRDLYTHHTEPEEMRRLERQGADFVFSQAPASVTAPLRKIWDEFEAKETLEAKIAHAIDRAHPILMNVMNGGRTWHDKGTDITKITDLIAFVRETDPTFHEFLVGVLAHAAASGFIPDPQEMP